MTPGGIMPEGIGGHVFVKDGQYLYVIWYFSNTQYSLELDFPSVEAAWNMYGNPLSVPGGVVTVSPDAPVYVLLP